MYELEDDLLEKRQRFEQLDEMSEDDKDFDEDEYDNLEMEIEAKADALIDLRSKMQCMDVISQIR